VASVGDGRFGAVSDSSSPSIAFEQRDAESSLQFGEALRQRRRAHADAFGGECPRRGIGHGHQVLELTDREVGERAAHPSKILRICFTIIK
jgi:hypothetical protein